MAKIQVQGIGMYDDKTLKKKIIQLASDLQKNAKKGDWNKASENGIRALGRMWQAYQDWSRQNESINEAVYKFKGMTASNMDELDADLSRENVKGTPDFNKMTYTIHKPKKDVYIDYYIKNKYKKFKPKRIKESVNEANNIDKIKDIVKKKQYKRIGGVIIDMQTANAIMKVHKALTGANKKKYEKLSISKMADIAYKLIK